MPDEYGFEYDVKTDILYRLITPKLDEVMSAVFAQSGEESGFELFRQLSRKIDPPRVDVAFDVKDEIEGLGKHSCSNFAQTARFLAMLNQRVRDFVFEAGEQFPLESLASIMRRAVDADTADRMDEGNVGLSDFPAVEGFIKKRESRLRSRGGAGAGKGPDAMVYGVSASEHF